MEGKLRSCRLLVWVLAASAGAPGAQETVWKTFGSGFESFGFALDPAGDVDGDGIGDVLVGRPTQYTSQPPTYPFDFTSFSFFFAGEASVLSGRTGAVLADLTNPTGGGLFGYDVAGGADLDLDDNNDYLVGAPRADGGAADSGVVVAFSGIGGAVLYQVPGASTDDDFGKALDVLDDVNGDGRPDFAVGAPRADVAGGPLGLVRVVSGLDGQTLYEILPPAGADAFGEAVASVEDRTGDGIRELLIGAPDAEADDSGKVYVLSGVDGAQLAVFSGAQAGDRLGTAVGPIGDLNRDLVPDLMLGAGGGRYALAVSGADLSLIEPLTSILAQPEIDGIAPRFGHSFCEAGDVDGDGFGDVALGSRNEPRVWTFSGRDGSVLSLSASTSFPTAVTIQFDHSDYGYDLCYLGDVDGNGRPDIAVGAPHDRDGSGPASGTFGYVSDGSVSALSGYIEPSWTRTPFQQVRPSGDVNADGCPDYVVSSTATDGGLSAIPARVTVYSGMDGSVLHELTGDALARFGAAISAAGDTDGDGFVDLVVGSPEDDTAGADAGSASIYSGVGGTLLFTAFGAAPDDFFGRSVGVLGDQNADGRSDWMAGAPQSDVEGYLPQGVGCSGYGFTLSVAGYVQVRSGADGSVLLHVSGPLLGPPADPVGGHFGYALSEAGDVDQDGTPDLAVGAPWGPAGVCHAGRAYVYSGSDGSLIHELAALGAGGLGHSVRGGPGFDFNADGVPDVVAGAQLGLTSITTGGARGSVHVFSGADGSVLGSWSEPPVFGYGGDVSYGFAADCAGDFNGDGFSDVLIGNPPAGNPQQGPSAGRVEVRSGADGSTLWSRPGNSSWDYFGYGLAMVGDLNQDGFSDVVAGAPADGKDHQADDDFSFARHRVFFGRPDFAPPDCNGNGINDPFELSVGLALDLDGDGVPDDCQPLSALSGSVSLTDGGAQSFVLQGGAGLAGMPYALVATLSGTSPGVVLGSTPVPFNPDPLTFLLFALGDTEFLLGGQGALDANGTATASLWLPPGFLAGLAGLEFHHIFVVPSPPGTPDPLLVSNPLPLQTTP